MSSNNYDTRKTTVIIYEGGEGEEDAIETVLEDGKPVPRVFKNLSKARKFAANNISAEDMLTVNFANFDPILGAGDRQETNNRKCLKCGGYLRVDYEKGQTRSQLPSGDMVVIEEYVCPKCDLNET